MKILLTGATGYIGRRLLPALLEQGHEVICCVRAGNRFFEGANPKQKVSVVEVDFLKSEEVLQLPADIDAAFFLMHSMSTSTSNFDHFERIIAQNLVDYINQSQARQIVYLSGLVPLEGDLSKHLKSRWDVECILGTANCSLTALRAGIIVGSGSASFEIIRDLVEKLPFMVAPAWLNHKVQPVAIRNVIQYLIGVLDDPERYNGIFDIGGPDILTYKEMLTVYAKVRKLRRRILTHPFMTPKMSSYWLYFVTTTSYKLALNLVESMRSDLICRDTRLQDMLGIEPIPYDEAIRLAFARIEQNLVLSSWKDAINDPDLYKRVTSYLQVPSFGCYKNTQIVAIGADYGQTLNNIWTIGGDKGWYYANWLWRVRGALDRFVGGVGLRRGRTHPYVIHPGDALDFWRVLMADRREKRLLLFAEMRMPGEAWLEFSIVKTDEVFHLRQVATFRPNGIFGRIYWFGLYPLHIMIFMNMARKIVQCRASVDMPYGTADWL